MKKFIPVIIALLTLFYPATVQSASLRWCEFDYTLWHYYMNAARWDSGLESMEWDLILKNTAREIYNQGSVPPEGVRNLAAWARVFLNEEGVFQTNCLLALSLPTEDMTVKEVVAGIKDRITSENFGRFMGYYAGRDNIVLVLVR